MSSHPTTVPIMKSLSASFYLQEFAVSASAAGLSHMLHHPLYTLKSHMMYYGKDFRMSSFVKESFTSPTGFLYRGMLYTIASS